MKGTRMKGHPMTDRFRLSMAQLNPTVGDIDGNAAKAGFDHEARVRGGGDGRAGWAGR